MMQINIPQLTSSPWSAGELSRILIESKRLQNIENELFSYHNVQCQKIMGFQKDMSQRFVWIKQQIVK